MAAEADSTASARGPPDAAEGVSAFLKRYKREKIWRRDAKIASRRQILLVDRES